MAGLDVSVGNEGWSPPSLPAWDALEGSPAGNLSVEPREEPFSLFVGLGAGTCDVWVVTQFSVTVEGIVSYDLRIGAVNILSPVVSALVFHEVQKKKFCLSRWWTRRF